MSSKLAKVLKMNVRDQQSIKKTTGTIKSVAEFLTDICKVTESSDFIKALSENVPWWLQAVGDSAAEAAPPIKFIAKLVGKLGEIRDSDRLAYLAFTTAYQHSLEKALRAVGPPAYISDSSNDWEPKSDIKSPDDGMTFNTYSFGDPFNHEFLTQANSLLADGMAAAGYNEGEIRQIQNELQMRFPGSLKALITHPSTREKFVALSDALKLGSKEERVYAAWLDHFEYQRLLFEDEKVFGEEPFSLSDVYIETECGLLKCEDLISRAPLPHSKKEASSRDSSERETDPFEESFGGRHDLVETVLDLIGDKAFRDAIVVQGAAGSGKSAFTLRLSVELRRNGLMPIRMRFRDIPLQSMNIEDALPEAVRFWNLEDRLNDIPSARPDELFLGMALFDQTVKFRSASICPWVLIIDGWDEVSIAAQKGFSVRIGEILAQVRDRFLNRGNRPLIRVILTGRPSTAVSSSSFLTKQTRLLTIRPLKPDQLSLFVYSLAERLAEPDNREQAKPDRFKLVLERYAEEFETRQKNYNYETKARGRMMEVLGLPLLTHLAVRLMVRWPDTNLSPIVENPTTLYRLLANLTCEKSGRYGADVREPEMPGEDLRRLLHETAAAMTVFGRDSIPYDELDFRLSQLNEELLERVQYATMDHPVTSLMISFFFKGGRTELGAEFLHKSFREFLFAEAVIEALKDYGRRPLHDLPERSNSCYWEDFEESDPRNQFSRRLGTLLAPQWISNEIALFIGGLIHWELERAHGNTDLPTIGESTVSLDLDCWKRVRDGLADLWDWWGEGVHLRLQPKFLGKKITGWKTAFVDELVLWAMPQDIPKGEIPSAARATSMDGHLGDGLFRLCCLVHHHVAVVPGNIASWESLDQPTHDAPPVRRYQSADRLNGEWQIRFKPSGQNDHYFFNYMARINAAGWHPGTVFPSGLFMQSIDLSNTFLALAGFLGCSLRDANIKRSNLVSAYLASCDLSNADLSNSRAPNACFDRCNMTGTRCIEMEAVGASFENTNLKNAVGTPSKKPRYRKKKLKPTR